MWREPPETAELEAFVSVADEGSVSAASRELGLPRATVSRRLAKLEERLGVRLIRRTTRQQQLTDLGEEFYAHARGVLDALAAGVSALRASEGEPGGLLRISTPPISAAWFYELMVGFVQRYPQVRVEHVSSSRHEDLIAQKLDVALRAGDEFEESLIAKRLLSATTYCVGAPQYLARRGRPQRLEELEGHDCLLGFVRGERPATHWPLSDGGEVRVRGVFVSNAIGLLLSMAKAGKGLALLPEFLCQKELERGELERVLPGELGRRHHLALVYPERELQKPAVRAFIDFFVEAMQSRAPLEVEGA